MVALVAMMGALFAPPERMSVSDWAEAHRYVGDESGSPFPGKWSNDRIPFLREVMDCCGINHPARWVVIRGSAQSGKSEAVLNAIGHAIDREPCPIMIFLPTTDEVRKYVDKKLQQTIEATPVLRAVVRDVVSRGDDGSTKRTKRFRGGAIDIGHASSSTALQMLSARLRVYEEIAGYPDDVDGRGPPIDQAEARGIAWEMRGSKSIAVSTPGIEGQCLITKMYDKGDQRRLFSICPHCGDRIRLEWPMMDWESDEAPHKPFVKCPANGCVLEERDRPDMTVSAVFVPTWGGEDGPGTSFAAHEIDYWLQRDPGGRYPSFSWWTAESPLVSWESLVAAHFKALETGPAALKAYWQQWLGLPFREEVERPAVDRLFERRETWRGGRIPAPVLFLTGGVDVQGNRLEWAVYGWGRDLSQWLVDKGVVDVAPTDPASWVMLDEVIGKRYGDAWGRTWPVDLWGIDSGYLSQIVYRYVRRHAPSGKIRALDGRPSWTLPALGTPRARDIDFDGRKIGEIQLWPVGTWDLKSELYAALAKTIAGPSDAGVWPAGCCRFPDIADRDYFEQLTREFLAERRTRTGVTMREWRKAPGANEQHDLAIYARALAHVLSDPLSEADWDALAGRRQGDGEAGQGDLLASLAPSLRADPIEPVPPEPQPARAAAERDAAPAPWSGTISPDDYWGGR